MKSRSGAIAVILFCKLIVLEIALFALPWAKTGSWMVGLIFWICANLFYVLFFTIVLKLDSKKPQ